MISRAPTGSSDPASRPAPWPSLPLESWQDTCATLHMWTQVVGKICLALTTPQNHFWNIAFQVTPRGLSTPPMLYEQRVLVIAFDFLEHRLVFQTSDGGVEVMELLPRTVADFYHEVMDRLGRLGITVKIRTLPVEVPDPIPFEQDVVHHSYDPGRAQDFWRILTLIVPVFQGFRCDFLGKCSPVHFFWGSFDLAVTRFSGRRAPSRPGADAVTKEAYSHEVISHGFWPGSGAVLEPAFYAYAAPEPPGFPRAVVRPAAAFYHEELREFILPYEQVRTAGSPEADLMEFLASTYTAGADLGGWNRADLERGRS